jgi:O-succinylbenzoic acid--CoA ligase
VEDRELVALTVDRDALPGPAMEAALDGSGPALLLVPPGPEGRRLAEHLLPAARDGVPADTALVIPTSGSTGSPKGVRISSAALDHSAQATHRHLGGPGQWLLAMSPARIAGVSVLTRCRAGGMAPVVTAGAHFDPAAFAAAAALLDRDSRRYTALVPTQLVRLLDAGTPLDTFDAILLGGGPIPDGLVARAAGRGARVIRTYGMTETCGGCVYDGLPLPGVRLMIGTGGLIRITGPVLARGYLGPRPAAAGPPGAQPGFTGAWFTSSDLGRLDSGGVLHVLGRVDDVIISGGVKVPAQSVEAVLAGHPSVAEVVVVGRPDREWGERVVAVVVPRNGTVDRAELRALVTARLGGPHAPGEFVVASAIPKLPSGKVDRARVRVMARLP